MINWAENENDRFLILGSQFTSAKYIFTLITQGNGSTEKHFWLRKLYTLKSVQPAKIGRHRFSSFLEKWIYTLGIKCTLRLPQIAGKAWSFQSSESSVVLVASAGLLTTWVDVFYYSTAICGQGEQYWGAQWHLEHFVYDWNPAATGGYKSTC